MVHIDMNMVMMMMMMTCHIPYSIDDGGDPQDLVVHQWKVYLMRMVHSLWDTRANH